MGTASPHIACFGPFQLDNGAGELRKDGQRIRLSEQPLQILMMLLERPGGVVTREEIRSKLWPNDTIVEFDNSINAAIKKVRAALGDSAEDPRYVETLARRGYRMMVPVERIRQKSPAVPQPAVESAPSESPAGSGNLSGKRISHYRVLEILGGGGMGVVYKGEDLKLGRQVALKFLPEELGNDTTALGRFEREARAASTLNHPNICTIHEFVELEGQPIIVMELLEGQTLREVIEAGALPGAPMRTEDVLDLATQIAEGLDAAHQKGIIHRDIKPANVFITDGGQAKILDFGLAKLDLGPHSMRPIPPAETAAGVLRAPPQNGPVKMLRDPNLTHTGVALGTAAYMSPEQVRGEKLDGRTDLFSFGLVLYEMATGQRAFSGDTSPKLHDAILNRTPVPARDLNPEIPARLEEIIDKALEKDREVRYQRASDLQSDLMRLMRDTSSRQSVVEVVAPPFPRRRWPLAVTGLVGLIAVSGLVWLATHRTPPLPEPKPRRLTANPPGNPATDAHISPDGKYLAYADQAGVHLQLIETGESRTIPQPQTVGHEVTGWLPVGWFPDGTKLLAQATSLGAEHSSVWVISMLGGAPREIREGALAWSVSPDGLLIAFTSTIFASDVWVMGVNGEQPRKIVTADEGESLNWVVWSPDSRRIAYERRRFRTTAFEPVEYESDIESRDLKGGQLAVVLSDPKLATAFGGFWWLADGRLMYSFGEAAPSFASTSDTNLWEIKVDAGSGKPAGHPRRITNWTDFSLAGPNATADGKRLAFSRVSAQADIYVGDLQAGGRRLKTPPRRLTLDERNDWPTAWTPNSKAILFTSDRRGNYDIYKQALDQDSAEPFVVTRQEKFGARLSPDGAWVIYVSRPKPEVLSTSAPSELRRVPVSGGPSQLVLTARSWLFHQCARAPANLCIVGERTQDRKQLVFTAFDPIKGRGPEVIRLATDPRAGYWWDLSPDGSQIATAYPAGENRIRLLPLAGGAPRDLVVNGWYGFGRLRWAPDGKGFYVSSSSPRGATLLYIDLEGHASPVWEQKGSFQVWGVPSPDGRHLAMMGHTVDSNVWMIENF